MKPLIILSHIFIHLFSCYAFRFQNIKNPFLSRISLVNKSSPKQYQNQFRTRLGSSSNIVKENSKITSKFSWSTEWYPVTPLQDLNKDGPNRITLLGKDFVVWYHRPTQSWRAFDDLCPHRLVPLSEGRIESNGNLQCAYHGWEFNQNGACDRIPQLSPANQQTAIQNSRSCVASFPVKVAQELLWIFPNRDEKLAETKPLPLIPELDDPDMIDGTNFFVRDMPYSWDILVENLCDPAHVPFAHHSFMRGADRDKINTDEESVELAIKITSESNSGFSGIKDPPPPGDGKYDFTFTAPCLLYARISNSEALVDRKAQGKGNNSVKLKLGNFIGLGQYCIPTAPNQCRLIARFPLRIPFPPAMLMLRYTPRWVTHFSQNIIMDSDVIFLCSQDEKLGNTEKRNKANYYLPSRADTMVTAFRRWLSTYGGNQPEWLGIPAARSKGEPVGFIRPQQISAKEGRDELLDRYRQHTDICSSCRQAHKNLHRMKESLLYGGLLLTIATAVASEKRIKLALGVASVFSLLLPKLILQPAIARMECAPWPRKKWIQSKNA